MNEKWIAAIFRKFAARYLNKWTTAIEGNEVFTMREWASCLGELTGDQVKAGLDHWFGEWPPNALEFKKCCLTDYEAKNIKFYKALPETAESRQQRFSKGKTEISKILIQLK